MSNHGGVGEVVAGGFVAVGIKQGKRPCYIYMAEVWSVQNENVEVTLKYMLLCSDNVYQWPESSRQEYSTEPIVMIVGPVQPPIMLNARGHFKFLSTDMARITEESKNKYKVVYFK